MKRHGKFIILIVFFGALLSSCLKDNDNNKLSLKESVNKGALDLNNAIGIISTSKAYGILTIDGTQKAISSPDSTYKINIILDSIKGTYDYQPRTNLDRWHKPLTHFFKKTADNTIMLVRMPLQKITKPWLLRSYLPADSLLKNNFAIAVSNYHSKYNSFWDFDYILESEIKVDDAIAGNLKINSNAARTKGVHYISEYSFKEGYTAKYQYDSGDSISSAFTILDGDNILYQEKRLTLKNDTARFGREHQYILTIGDVQIVRKSTTKKVEIYLKGQLQTKAIVEIVDKDSDPEASVCKKRDIQITFDDGTVKKVSELIGASVNDIKKIFESLHQVYFASYIVDWIAFEIYLRKY